jgi:hypothetical protein
LDQIFKLEIKTEFEFKEDYTKAELGEIESLLERLNSRFSLLHDIINMLWESYLVYIGILMDDIPDIDTVIRKSNADRLFQQYSMIRSMSFYLNKMLHQRQINQHKKMIEDHQTLDITDIQPFDTFKSQLGCKGMARLLKTTCEKIRGLTYVP